MSDDETQRLRDQLDRARCALEAIAESRVLNDDYLEEQRLMVEALKPFEGRLPLSMRVEEAEKKAARLQAALAALVAAYDVRGSHSPDALGYGVDWDPDPETEQAGRAWAEAVKVLP